MGQNAKIRQNMRNKFLEFIFFLVVVGYLFSLKVSQECQNASQKLENFRLSIDFTGGSEYTRASEGPQNGGKMTRMDILEFRDINGPDPYNKIWFK